MLISLIGYRGTGKTTVGSLLAERLGWSSVDADIQLETDAGMSIRQIFDVEGELGFRNRETAVLEKLTRLHKSVLSLGGGIILREQNRKMIRNAGPAIWLTASPQELYRRIEGDPVSASQRPNLSSAGGGLEEITNLLNERIPLYKSCADFEVDTEAKSPGQIADEAIKLMGLSNQSSG